MLVGMLVGYVLETTKYFGNDQKLAGMLRA